MTPGSGGGFYCENCRRDGDLLAALARQGHDVLTVPMYLPAAAGDSLVQGSAPLFFGGIKVYLQQKAALFRRIPKWFERILDSPRLLRLASRFSTMTSAGDLAETTLTMLRGEEGLQSREIDRLARYLSTIEPPDVVCLSNALLAGLAGPIKKSLRAPVVCLLQDEDGWIDAMAEPHRTAAWDLIAQKTKDIDLFAAVSGHYAGVMRELLGVPERRVRVVYPGIAAERYGPAGSPPEAPTIGYMAPASPEWGLDKLIDAFLTLKREPELGRLRLRVAATAGTDGAFLKKARARIAAARLARDVDFLPGTGYAERPSFPRTLSVFSVPTVRAEAFGTYVLEAMACGVPVVQPRMGAFPEILAATGGGVLFEPGEAGSLASSLRKLLLDPEARARIGRKGRAGVLERFTAADMARTMAEVCREAAG